MTDLYTRIEQANSEIAYIDVKGKDYAQVHERVKAFRKVYPGGTIITEIVENSENVVIVCAEVSNDQGEVISTGHAKEFKNGSMINKASWLENCETSAVGRALGLAGFGIKAAIATDEELSGSLAEQDRLKTEETRQQKIGLNRAIALSDALKRTDINVSELMKHCGVDELADITEEQFLAINKMIKEREKKK